MNLSTEKNSPGKVRMVVRGSDCFRTTAAAMIIASGFEPNPDQVAVIDTNSNYIRLFAGWGFHNVLPAPPPCTLAKMLEAIDAAKSKRVLVIDSLDTFMRTLIDLHTKHGEIDHQSILDSHGRLVDRLMESSNHVIASIRITEELPEGIEVFGLEELEFQFESDPITVFDLEKFNSILSKDIIY
jgi:hypothetical protein